jgi:spermidine/putrescine-binding protein
MKLLKSFKPQVRAIAPNYGEPAAMYQRGEIVLSVGDWTPTLVTCQAAGIDVRSTIPEEGGFSFVDNWMTVVGAANPAGAYAVIDQAISAEAQAVIGKSTGLGIVNPQAVPALGDAVADAWHYEQLEQTFARAPLYRGVPVEADGDVTTYEEWLAAWTDFKAS